MNDLFLYALDALLERSSFMEANSLRMITKAGRDKIDKIIHNGVDISRTKHLITSSAHTYFFTTYLRDERLVVRWECLPWFTNIVMMVFCSGDDFPRRSHCYCIDSVSTECAYAATLLLKSFPEFRWLYAEQTLQTQFS